ncbi:MAG TPA: pirin family protein [Kofleriaceae bacterium]|nr:pirin family protein [Kofleriaceae bacterium]
MSTLPCDEPACVDRDGDHAIELVVEGRPREVGTITVARLLPSARRRMVGPFIFLDHMGPVELAPGVGFDIRPHPHIGLSTVTYFLAGENVHRDSLGNVQINRPGDVNLMTAGRGVVHSERADPAFRARGGAMHGAQIWLALPDDHEEDAPSFEHHREHTLPAIAPGPGVRGRVLIGEAFGARSPIRHPSAPLLVDLLLAIHARATLAPEVAERAVFVLEGELAIGGATVATDRLAVLAPGRAVEVCANRQTRALVLGGAPLPPRFIEWNFVASSRERIARARDAWKARQFPTIPTDSVELIPWPDDHP